MLLSLGLNTPVVARMTLRCLVISVIFQLGRILFIGIIVLTLMVLERKSFTSMFRKEHVEMRSSGHGEEILELGKNRTLDSPSNLSLVVKL